MEGVEGQRKSQSTTNVAVGVVGSLVVTGLPDATACACNADVRTTSSRPVTSSQFGTNLLTSSSMLQPSLFPTLQACLSNQLLKKTASQPLGVQLNSAIQSFRHSVTPPIFIQPSRPFPGTSQSGAIRVQPKRINFNVKIINTEKKKEFETYVLRNVTKDSISTPPLLRKELLHQFGDRLVSRKQEFAVGFMKNSSKVSIRSSADIEDVWQYALKDDQITLWCHGITASKRKNEASDSESDEELFQDTSKQTKKKRKLSALEEKNERVEKIVTSLREKHANRFTTIQFRLWAEMVDVGTHRFVRISIMLHAIPKPCSKFRLITVSA